jgi:hypothetical protein
MKAGKRDFENAKKKSNEARRKSLPSGAGVFLFISACLVAVLRESA